MSRHAIVFLLCFVCVCVCSAGWFSLAFFILVVFTYSPFGPYLIHPTLPYSSLLLRVLLFEKRCRVCVSPCSLSLSLWKRWIYRWGDCVFCLFFFASVHYKSGVIDTFVLLNIIIVIVNLFANRCFNNVTSRCRLWLIWVIDIDR